MQLDEQEIRIGLVAYLDEECLWNDTQVTRYHGRGSLHTEPQVRPFVCIKSTDEECQWTPLTTESHTNSGYLRLYIRPEWKSGGSWDCHDNQWVNEDSYLVDGANLYTGAPSSFAQASSHECTCPDSRAEINEDGISAIRGEVQAQAHRSVEA